MIGDSSLRLRDTLTGSVTGTEAEVDTHSIASGAIATTGMVMVVAYCQNDDAASAAEIHLRINQNGQNNDNNITNLTDATTEPVLWWVRQNPATNTESKVTGRLFPNGADGNVVQSTGTGHSANWINGAWTLSLRASATAGKTVYVTAWVLY